MTVLGLTRFTNYIKHDLEYMVHTRWSNIVEEITMNVIFLWRSEKSTVSLKRKGRKEDEERKKERKEKSNEFL